MILQRVRVKAGSAEAMEMNGRVNREVDWGASTPRVARSAIFSLHFSAPRGRAHSYLSRSEISNRAAIHHWLTCYWSPGHLLFSTKLYYKKKKKKNSKCLLALSGPHFLPASAKALEKGKKNEIQRHFFLYVCDVRQACQAILFKEIRVVVLKVTSVEQV